MRLTHLMMASLAIGFTTSLQAADFTFKYAHSQTDEAPRSESMRYFKEALEERSDGRIAVELYFNGTLGKEEDVLQQVQMGLIQGYRGGLFAQANPAYLIYTMPFLFTTPEQAIDVMEGELGQAINEGARESQLHIPVTGVAGGMRQLTCGRLKRWEPPPSKCLTPKPIWRYAQAWSMGKKTRPPISPI